MKKPVKIHPWRVNYIVTYQNSYYADAYRKPVLEILQNIALLREIDCAVSSDHRFGGELNSDADKAQEDFVFDLVYFRSEANTKIPVSSFRKLIDSVFEEHRFLVFARHHFDVVSQPVKHLRQYPFPDD